MNILNNPLHGSKTKVKDYLLNFNIRLRKLELLSLNPWSYSLLWDTMTTDDHVFIIVDTLNRFLPPRFVVIAVSRLLSQHNMSLARKWKSSHGARFIVDESNNRKTPIVFDL